MINKLKYKFILISMILVSSVLVFIVTAITFLTCNKQYNDTKDTLAYAVSFSNTAEPTKTPDAFYGLYYVRGKEIREIENHIGEIDEKIK